MTADRLNDLVTRYYHGDLSAAETAELSAALKESAEARKLFADAALLEAGLVECFPLPLATELAEPGSPRRRSTRRRVAAVLAASVLVAAGWWVLRPAGPGRAMVEAPTGVVILGAEGRMAWDGVRVSPGQTVSTVGVESGVTLKYPDGTRLFLGGDTTVTLTDGGVPRVDRGDVAADLSGPARLSTRAASVVGGGGKVLVTRREGATVLGVADGSVVVSAAEGGKSVRMGGGERAEIQGGQVNMLPPAPPAPDTYALRFGGRLPDRWEVGTLVTHDLPPDSVAACRAAFHQGRDGRTYFQVRGANAWTEGLFALHPDTWVSVRYRAEKPGWFHLLVVARHENPVFLPGRVLESPHTLWRDRRVGEWHTVHMRLSDFKLLRSPVQPPPGQLVAFLLVASTDADRGVTIDRLWVTRGPEPGPFPE